MVDSEKAADGGGLLVSGVQRGSEPGNDTIPAGLGKPFPAVGAPGGDLALDFAGAARSRRNATGETSREAAASLRFAAPRQRERVYNVLRQAGTPMSAEEIAFALDQAGWRDTFMSVRPRCSDLNRAGLIKDSGERGPSAGGGRSIRWSLA